jgi:hypothetical protein
MMAAHKGSSARRLIGAQRMIGWGVLLVVGAALEIYEGRVKQSRE